MDFKNVSRSLFLISCFLASYSAEKPGPIKPRNSEDVMEAAKCLQLSSYPVYGGDIREWKLVTEFLDNFCANNSIMFPEIKEMIDSYKSSFGINIDIASDIRQCLQLRSKQELFDKYKNFGRKFLNENFETYFAENSRPTNGDNDLSKRQPSPDRNNQPEWTSSYFVGGTVQSRLSSDPSMRQFQELLLNEGVNGDNKNFREFVQFSIGLCERPEIFTFDQLTDPDKDKEREEKMATLKCSFNCVKTFFGKIHNEFTKDSETLERVYTSVQGIKISEKFPDVEQYNKVMSSSPGMFPNITDKTKSFLEKYNDAYKQAKVRYRFNPLNIVHMDGQLSSIYSNYKKCLRWECSMDTEKQDIPLSERFMKNAESEDIKDHSIYRALVHGAKIKSQLVEDKGPVGK